MAKESNINIKIGKYRLTADDMQFIVCQKKTHRTGKLKGTSTEVEFTFHPTLLHAAENIMKRKVLASKAVSMGEMIAIIKKQNNLMQRWFNESIKADVKIGKKEKKTPVKKAKKKVNRETLSSAKIKIKG